MNNQNYISDIKKLLDIQKKSQALCEEFLNLVDEMYNIYDKNEYYIVSLKIDKTLYTADVKNILLMIARDTKLMIIEDIKKNKENNEYISDNIEFILDSISERDE